MRKLHTIFLLLLLSTSITYAQKKNISGQVVDKDNGQPLPGATIVIAGSTSGTFSDNQGKFSIQSSSNDDKLVISFIGYVKQEIVIGSQTEFTIQLQLESNQIEDLIVTAIGIKSEKKSLGYAAQEVKGSDITSVQQANIVNSLSSKVAGISVVSSAGSPGASSSIQIRGRSSFRADKQSPLFVVDGVPIDNSYSGNKNEDYSNRAIDINSDDIESVTVLKGAGASALYGIRASNGAIIITTKSGKKKGAIKRNITFKTSLGIDVINKIPEVQNKYSQGEGGNYKANSNYSWGALIDTLRYDGIPNSRDKNGNIVGMSSATATNNKVIPYDNINKFFQTAYTSNIYLSISGGNDFGNYLFSVGRLKQTGIVPESYFNRNSFKLSGDTKLTDKLKISGSATYSISDASLAQKGSNTSGIMLGLLRCPPTFDLSNGTSDPVNNKEAYILPDGSERMYNLYDNPYWSVNKNKAFDKVNRVIGNSQIDYTILPWLTAMYRIGLDYYSNQRNKYMDNLSSERKTQGYPGFVTNSIYNFSGINSDFTINAEKEITKDIKITTLLGHNYYTKSTYETWQQGDVFVLPNYYDISNTTTKSGDDRKTKYKIVGAYYDIKLTYKNFLFFNTTGRNDWSSTLPKGKNSFFYPSFNASFIFTEAFNINKNSYLNYGKIRASWAQVGNDADVYSLNSYYSGLNPINGQLSYATQLTVGNLNIKPETTKSTEIGLDLRLFNNRLGIDLAVYQSRSIGQIIPLDVVPSTGFDKMIQNSGTINNKGIEAQIFITPIKNHDFTWDMMINFAKNKNLVEDLPNGLDYLGLETSGLGSITGAAVKGKPYGVFLGTRYLRNNKGQILVYDTGYPAVTTSADIGSDDIIGDPNPDFTLGLRNSISFKIISFSALIDINYGGDFYNGTKNSMNQLGTGKETENRDQDYVVPGVNINTGLPNEVVIKRNSQYYAGMGGNAGLGENGIEDGSFIRLREVSLSINIPAKWLGKTPISAINFGVSGRNLILFTKATGIDPETNLSGVSNSFGRDYYNLPNTKGIDFNLQLTF